MASGKSCRTRSAHLPLRYLSSAAVASAAPSMMPRKAAPAPSETRNGGKSGITMSLETSAKKDTTPSSTTLRCRPFTDSRALQIRGRLEHAQARRCGRRRGVCARRVERLERSAEALRRPLQIEKRDLALVELPVGHHPMDGAVDEALQLFGRDALEVARGRHHHVGDHHQRGLARLRLWPGVAGGLVPRSW